MTAPFAASHKAASDRFYETAKRLERTKDELAAVCYFYSAYRAIRSAMCVDARLDSDSNAKAVHLRLSASSRHVDFHNGHPNRGPGLNEITRILYQPIGSDYELMHIQSNAVRYGDGLKDVSIADVRALAESVRSHLTSEGLF